MKLAGRRQQSHARPGHPPVRGAAASSCQLRSNTTIIRICCCAAPRILHYTKPPQVVTTNGYSVPCDKINSASVFPLGNQESTIAQGRH